MILNVHMTTQYTIIFVDLLLFFYCLFEVPLYNSKIIVITNLILQMSLVSYLMEKRQGQYTNCGVANGGPVAIKRSCFVQVPIIH